MPTSRFNDSPDLISVVVPFFNEQRYLGKCLKSIIGQSYKNLEIIVVNDGSTDSSPEIVRQFAASDKRVVLVNQANCGRAAARKSGYLNATGSWIVFVDSDDYLPVDSIEALYSASQEHHADVVCGDFWRKWGLLRRYRPAFPREMGMRAICSPELFSSYYLSFFGVNLFPVNVCGKIYRKDILDRVMKQVDIFMTPPLRRAQDEALNVLLFPHLSSIYCLEKAVYVYRFGGITSGNRYLTDLLDFGDFRIGLLDKYHYDAGYSPLFVEYVNILITNIQLGLEFRTWTVDEAKQWLREELDGRYLVKRMENHFLQRTEIPDKCRKAIDRDIDGILGLVSAKLEQQRLRSLAKKILLRKARH